MKRTILEPPAFLGPLSFAGAAALLGVALAGRPATADLPLLPAPSGRAFDAPVPIAPTAPAEALAPQVEGAGTWEDPARIDFSAFVFPDYDPPELRGADAGPLPLDAFPPAVAAQAGRVVRVEGYMLAVNFVDGAMESFVLSRFPPGCCFGATPVFDEWLSATPGKDGVEQRSSYAPLAVVGVLEVGEALDEAGFVTSLFRLSDARVSDLR